MDFARVGLSSTHLSPCERRGERADDWRCNDAESEAGDPWQIANTHLGRAAGCTHQEEYGEEAEYRSSGEGGNGRKRDNGQTHSDWVRAHAGAQRGANP